MNISKPQIYTLYRYSYIVRCTEQGDKVVWVFAIMRNNPE